MTKALAEEILGQEHARMDDGQGGIAHVYALAWSGEPRVSQLLTYVVIRYAGGVADMIQISGERPPNNHWRFSSIRLGDSEQVVFDIFGAPFAQEHVQFNDAQLWRYGPWPFSFEIKNRQVVSIRLAE